MMFAAQRGQLKVVQALLEAGADKKVMDEAGKLALDYAVAGNFTDVVAVLKGEALKKPEPARKPVAPPKAK